MFAKPLITCFFASSANATTKFGRNFATSATRRSTANKTNASQKFRFDNRTAIITGGARGIGLEYAKLLASRGANVVINDFGGATSGELVSSSSNSAQSVAQQAANEIQEKFATGSNKIIPNANSVSCEKGVKELVDQTLSEFGRIDILINNAGILRDKSFAKMTIEDWDQVQQVHLRGSFLVTHACWPLMRQQSFGRIIMASSTSGIYGNFGQANYAAAKLGLVGLSNTLALEGAPKNIHSNVIFPMAASRMTKDIIPDELAQRLQPKYIAPIVAWLCHENCRENGAIFEASGRWFGRHKLIRSPGRYISNIGGPEEDASSLEKIDDCIEEIGKFANINGSGVESFGDHLADLMSTFEKNK